jgi:hypothetical protein
MSDGKKSRGAKAKRPPRRPRRAPGAVDPLERDFGPGVKEEPSAPEPSPAPPSGPISGLACGGESCLLRPAADLVGKFALSLAGRAALGRAAGSGLELLKALRDFLDEEISLAERAAGKDAGGAPPRYEKIPVS